MTTAFTSAPVEQITVDVTGWEQPFRTKLIRAINAVREEAEVAAAAPAPVDASADDSGWDAKTVSALLAQLEAAGATVQIQVMKTAVANGGEITREEVYEIGKYAATRSLKGFTRAINRIVGKMKDQNVLPEDAIDPFVPVYDPNIKGYQQAKGFIVPAPLIALMQ